MENTEDKIRKLLQKLVVAEEVEAASLAAELRVLLRAHFESLREKASPLRALLDDDDSGSNAAD